MKKLLIFGAGQLGQAYFEYFENYGWLIKIADKADIRNITDIETAIQDFTPDIVINVAAQTDIDWCEDHKLECFEVNTLGADNVGLACQMSNVYLVHISSGCIQETPSLAKASEGLTPHKEEDIPNPLCFYSWTKVWAENLLTDRLQHRGKSSDLPKPLKVLILRPRQLLSAKLSPRNALAKMMTYAKFVDTPNSCTIIEDLLWVTGQLLDKNSTGVYNVVNPGIITPYQIALLLKEKVLPEMQVDKISKQELNKATRAKRIDSVLDTDKLKTRGISLKEINQRLEEILPELKNNIQTPEGQKLLKQIQEETSRKIIT